MSQNDEKNESMKNFMKFFSFYRAQGDQQGFLQGPSIQLVVRRSHLFEDAFDKLRPENGKCHHQIVWKECSV